MEHKLRDFTNVFVFSASKPEEAAVLSEIPKTLDIDPARQRRGHRKSLAGCDGCKRRHVKPVSTSCEGLLAVSSLPPLPSHSSSSSAVVNLLHLRLFHHFQTHTKNVLPFASSAWDVAVRLSWEHAFLADALLCVAARHLAVLQQDTVESAAFASAAATHLCRALSGFRYSLTTNLAGMPFDVFIASSILLQIELWTSTEFIISEETAFLHSAPA
ncbi:MAG: hypothetical protein STHCBS139747_002106 [Sporothrix thermara]